MFVNVFKSIWTTWYKDWLRERERRFVLYINFISVRKEKIFLNSVSISLPLTINHFVKGPPVTPHIIGRVKLKRLSSWDISVFRLKVVLCSLKKIEKGGSKTKKVNSFTGMKFYYVWFNTSFLHCPPDLNRNFMKSLHLSHSSFSLLYTVLESLITSLHYPFFSSNIIWKIKTFTNFILVLLKILIIEFPLRWFSLNTVQPNPPRFLTIPSPITAFVPLSVTVVLLTGYTTEIICSIYVIKTIFNEESFIVVPTT